MNSKSLTRIALTRRPEQYGSFMNLKVFVDGKVVGELPYATRVIFPVDPGGHEVHIKMEMNYIKSKQISVQVAEGETVELNCGSRFRGWQRILNLILPTSLEIKSGAIQLNKTAHTQTPIKLGLLFLLPTILMPVFLFYMALIVFVPWFSEGLFKTAFGANANFAQLIFILLGIGAFIGTIGVRFWRWLIRNQS
jgi:hypothetical protein